jgi:hypothetical protein
MPTPTDLVTDLPADFEVFGQAVDTSMADLKGGTTGQILSKATNTDMDFTWITNDVGDITAVNVTAPITGGGSSGAVTIGVSAASTAASGVVQLSDSTSTTSSVLASTPTATKSAYDLANTANTAAGAAQTTANNAYAAGFTNNYFAGKNKMINGKFDVWQRGTSFSNPATTAYTADRFMVEHDGSGATRTVSQQTFTPGTAPVSGYESQYYLQYAVTGGTANTFQQVQQRIEDVRTFAGQTVTFSFWAKADAARTIDILNNRNFGTGGSTADQSAVGSTLNITTSWARYSVSATLGSVSGKTIGANSFATWIIRFAAATAQTIQIWGVQLEAGSVATPFQTASGSLQGELALCQRYYYRTSPTASGSPVTSNGGIITTTIAQVYTPLPVTMRTNPSAMEFSAINWYNFGNNTEYNSGTFTLTTATPNFASVRYTHGSAIFTAGQVGAFTTAGASSYIAFTAEL